MTITKLRSTYTFGEDRLDQLRALVPEAFADGRIDWDTLRDLLGDAVEDPAVEHFGLSWPGKREARRLASRPSRGALVPVPGEGINEDTTRNIFIEGENLEVLKLLLKSYAGRVKMIYIDPPYNTGNDFIYSDDFSEPLQTYLRRTNQADEEGILSSNPKAGGRFHSNWLSMMLPRLLLARQVLSPDGAILISIDDTEVHNLRLVLNETFGEENFVANIVWQKAYTANMTAKFMSNTHDHLLVYAKDNEHLKVGRLERSAEQLAKFTNPDNDPRGPWKAENLSAGKFYAAGRFEIVTPAGLRVKPPPGRYWRCNEETYLRWLNEGRITFGKDGTGRPMLKNYLSGIDIGLTPSTWWGHQEVGSNKEASLELKELFDREAVFDTPKPLRLFQRILNLFCDQRGIVLDFFAGSGSLAHAVWRANRSDAGNRRFVLVQLPEPTSLNDLPTIAEVSKERLRRSSAQLRAQDEGKLNLVVGNTCEDLGFRVYRLDQSHFKPWTDYSGDDVATLQAQFDAFESPLVDGWQPNDLLVEIMLMEGFPLDSTVTRQTQFAANDVQLVESDFHEHRLWVCLDQRIEPRTASALATTDKDVFICLDSALDDEMKLKLSDGGNLKTI